jgi:putative ABC transport system permease protein
LRIQEEEVQAGRDRLKASVVGTTPTYMEVLPMKLAEGRFFHYHELEDATRVCVLGGALRRELFPLGEALGKRVKVGQDWYTVVGVMASVSQVDEDESGAVRYAGRDLYIPLSASLLRFEPGQQLNELTRIVVQVQSESDVDQAAGLVETVLSRRHAGTPDYSVVVPVELIRRRQATSRIFNLVMGAIAGISLLVGGIGIMNIMLASVLERTREIGVRRALGATRADVLAQFLLEAVAVSFFGGLLGVALGIGLTRGIAVWAGWSTVVSLQAIVLAFGVSALVGIVFGWYPARRAARLSPIECLRYE